MALSTQTFTQLVQNAVTAIQGAASQLIDVTVGSVLRAAIEANAAVTLWLQGLALQIAALTRLATSNGSDADSFGADFGFTRLPALAAVGQVTFARFTPTNQATIQAATSAGLAANGQTIWAGGALVQTADGTQQFMVIPDTTQTAYNPTLNAYVISPGTGSAIATVQAVNAVAATNTAAGVINTLAQAIPYIDTVTNASAFTNGADPEADSAFRARFVTWIASLARGTKGAIINAVLSIQQGMSCQVIEDYTYAGAYQPGYFYVVVDDGSGHPSSTLLSTASNAVDAVRPVGSTFGVFGPVVVTANVAMSIATATGYVHATVVSQVQAALTTYINSLPLGATLPYSRLSQVAYGTSPGITNVTAVTLNSGTADLSVTSVQVIKVGSCVVS